MKRILRGLSLGLLVLYLGVLGLLFVSQRSLLYPGAGRDSPLPAAEAGLTGFEDVVLATPDGERLMAWWKPPQPGKALLIYFHGNGGSLRNRRFRAEALTQGGRGLLLVSYRGYSGSSGSPSEEGLRIDARTAYDWAARSHDLRRIVLYGESLGTGVAVRLATERRIGGLILDAPYTSTAEVASGLYWYVPVSWLMLDQYRSIDVIGEVKAPILVMHGDQDRIIPFAFGERLYAAAPEPKRFLRLPGVGHTRVLESGGLAAVNAFLSQIEAGSPSSQASGTP
jgi:hypothetical protein